MKSIASLAMTVAVSTASAQVVNVNAGETLTEADLLAGSFNGQSFTLGPDATFNINDGGTIGPLGERNSNTFDVMDAVINIHDGGVFADESQFSNATINLLEGGLIDGDRGAFGSGNSRSESLSDVVINMSGGVLNFLRSSGDTVLNITGGTFRNGPFMDSGTTTNLFVTSLSLNDSPIDLIPGESVSIDTSVQNYVFEAILEDGEFVTFTRGDIPAFPGYVPSDGRAFAHGILTATLVPAPSAAALAPLGCLATLRRRR